MGMYIYVDEQDRIKKRKVSDKHINEEFQEALKCEPKLMIEERNIVEKRLFRKDIVKTIYDVYHETEEPNKPPYQARYQFSGSGDKRIVLAYLHGIVNGYHSKSNS